MLICTWIKFASFVLFEKLADYRMSEGAHKNITFLTITDSFLMKTSAEFSMLTISIFKEGADILSSHFLKKDNWLSIFTSGLDVSHSKVKELLEFPFYDRGNKRKSYLPLDLKG